MSGEIHLTADVLWLSDLDGEAPPRDLTRPNAMAPTPVRV
jgi:hypothetical protein